MADAYKKATGSTMSTGAPAPNVQRDNFSVRWTGKVRAPVTGNFTFATIYNDGVRLWVNGQLLIDDWTNRGGDKTSVSATMPLVANTDYDIRMDFYDRSGNATARLLWAYPGQAQTVIPQTQLFPQ